MDIVNRAHVDFVSVDHRQDLPIAPSIFGDSSEICASIEIVGLAHETLLLAYR